MVDEEIKRFITKDFFLKNSILEKENIFLTNFFLVDFELPKDDKDIKHKIGTQANKMGLGFGDLSVKRNLSFNVSKVSMPGHNISLKRVDNTGPQRFIYSKKEYQDLSISFIETADLKIKNFFKYWISRGFDDITGQRRFFPDDISAKIIVYPLLPNGSKIFVNKEGEEGFYNCEIFCKCLPYEVADYEYDVTDSDSTLKLTEVKFAYRYHFSQYEKTIVIPNKY